MSTSHTANVYIQNATGGKAVIRMSHQYSSSAVDSGVWTVEAGQSAGPLVVHFETGFGTGLDYWYCSATVMDGPTPGVYASEGSLAAPVKECELKAQDAGSTFVNVVDPAAFHMNQPSGGCTTAMVRTAPYSPVTNVFVLMLENRSFDHIFGFSGIANIDGLQGNESNTYNGTPYPVTRGVVDPMTTDPNHELLDTLEQLCGQRYAPASPRTPNGLTRYPAGPYPPIDNSGFVANYATIADEDTGLPGLTHVGDVMHCALPTEVPVMTQLAKEFVVCDHWYSSVPGPTWPNRLFAMGASSSGLDVTPKTTQILEWETVDGFKYQQNSGGDRVGGSLFQLLSNHGLRYRLYNDISNQFAAAPAPFYEGGGFAIMAALKGVQMIDVNSFAHFASDLQGPYPYELTFIEPNYGNAKQDTYSGGSSQHPMDSLAAGEAFIAATYNAIRSSPLWSTSVLIVTYDEHGGFYDHVAPPAATPPGDGNPFGYNQLGYDFANYGVRVPAVIVSPLVSAGVDSTHYDHSSIAKTLEILFGLPALTARDDKATGLNALWQGNTTPRSDCPEKITVAAAAPRQVESRPAPASETDDLADATPLPEAGNIIGFLHVAAKTDIELSGGGDAAKTAVIARVGAITTYGQARQYFQEVMLKLQAAQAARKQ